MNRWVVAALCATLVGIGACATGRRAPPPPPPPPSAADVRPQAPAAGPPSRSTSQPAGSTCRYCVTSDIAKRQYFDQRRKRYYYFDRGRKAYFWENGEPKS